MNAVLYVPTFYVSTREVFKASDIHKAECSCDMALGLLETLAVMFRTGSMYLGTESGAPVVAAERGWGGVGDGYRQVDIGCFP